MSTQAARWPLRLCIVASSAALVVAALILLLVLPRPRETACWTPRLDCLGTKTSYEALLKQWPPAGALPESCRPLHVAVLNRHGARSQSSGAEEDLVALADKLRNASASGLAPGLPAWLEAWQPPHGTAGALLPSGARELAGLGSRLRARLGRDVRVPPSAVDVRWTHKQRTQDSGRAFVQGFYAAEKNGEASAENVLSRARVADALLRPWEGCAAYDAARASPAATAAPAAFARSAQADAARVALARAAGYTAGAASDLNSSATAVSAAELGAAMGGCGDQQARSKGCTHHQWCELVDQQPSCLETAAKADDLENFFTHGYGVPINYVCAFELLRDIFASLSAAAARPRGAAASAQLSFAHAETLIPAVAALGLRLGGADLRPGEPRPAEAMAAAFESDPDWRMCTLSPFAASLQFILYRCSDADEAAGGEPPPLSAGARLRVLLNEQDVAGEMSGCSPGEALCELGAVQRGAWVRAALDGYGFDSREAACAVGVPSAGGGAAG